MAKRSVAAAPPCCNDKLYKNTVILAELFQLSYQYYVKRSFLDEQAFIGFLRSFIESIEAICQKNTTISLDYHIDCVEFHRYIRNGFWQEAPTLEPFFYAIAHLVQYAVESFRILDYPDAYQTFLYQLNLIFNNDAVVKAGKKSQADLLVEQLQEQ